MARQASFSLFKKADVEGYLDKLNSGITSRLMAGKTRVWCELYGTTLYIFKESKRSSTGAQQLDMKQVQMVRKATSDRTGTHFEVLVKNKSQTFSASSVDDCNNWIRHLQRAMALKDQETQQVLDTSEVSTGDYETISMLPEDNRAAPQLKTGEQVASESDYAEIGFQNTRPPAPTQPLPADRDRNAASAAESDDHGKTGAQQQNLEAEGDYGYAAVEVRKNDGSRVEKGRDSRAPVTAPCAQPAAPQPCGTAEEYGYAKVEVRAKRDSPQSQSLPACPPVPRTEGEGSEEDSYGYATVNPRTTLPSISVHSADYSGDSPRTAGDGESDDPSDEDDVYIDAMSSRVDPGTIPPFPHPLGPGDTKPLATLLEFLSNNRKVCRRSFLDRTVVDDPVSDMKRLLQELYL